MIYTWPEVTNVLKEKIPQASWMFLMFLSLAHIEFIHIQKCAEMVCYISFGCETRKVFSTLHMLHGSYTPVAESIDVIDFTETPLETSGVSKFKISHEPSESLYIVSYPNNPKHCRNGC